MAQKKRFLILFAALAALAALVALAGASVAALEPEAILTAIFPGVGPGDQELGVAPAQSGGGYHLTAMSAPGQEAAPSGQAYNLTTINTRRLPGGSKGTGYRLVSLTPEKLQDNVCTHLPIVLRQW